MTCKHVEYQNDKHFKRFIQCQQHIDQASRGCQKQMNDVWQKTKEYSRDVPLSNVMIEL